LYVIPLSKRISMPGAIWLIYSDIGRHSRDKSESELVLTSDVFLLCVEPTIRPHIVLRRYNQDPNLYC
jgi:hypothetical protein